MVLPSTLQWLGKCVWIKGMRLSDNQSNSLLTSQVKNIWNKVDVGTSRMARYKIKVSNGQIILFTFYHTQRYLPEFLSETLMCCIGVVF